MKPVVFLTKTFKTPPFTPEGRIEAGILLRMLQMGEKLSMPSSRPMPSIGPRCHEPRVRDGEHNRRIIYRLDEDSVVVVEVFPKKTDRTSVRTLEVCRRRLAELDRMIDG